MDALRRLAAVLRADLRERTRSTRFWVVLSIVALATWWCFPAIDAGYLTVSLGGSRRGAYSSAWVGMALALECSTMLALVGFYLVRGTLVRDFDTRVWQLLVATPMTRTSYLLAKWLSHMVVFGLIVLVGLGVALLAQLLRGEDRAIHLVELVKPVLVLSLPALAMSATFAVWFDMVPWLRRTAGNIIYFFVWTLFLGLSVAVLGGDSDRMNLDSALSDPGGLIVAMRDFTRELAPRLGADTPMGLTVGVNMLHSAPKIFSWTSWSLRAADLLGRFAWLIIAVLGTMAAAPFLDRAAAHASAQSRTRSDRAGLSLRWLDFILRPLQRGAFGNLVAAELRLGLRQRGWFWWLLLLSAGIVQVVTPVPIAAIAVIAAWMLALDLYARAGLRERDHGTAALVFINPGSPWRLPGARLIALTGLAWATTLPALLRFSTSMPAATVAILLIGASLALWGMALGALCRNPRVLELLVVAMAWVSVQGAPLLNVAVSPGPTGAWHAALLPLAAACFFFTWPRLRQVS
ncbi:MAG: hypothetical protein ABI411_12200 [Tahibacter sp.]